jgi:acyl carrier protein
MSTLQTIQQVLAGELSLEAGSLDPARPLDELGIDSLTVIECLFKLEDKFGISIGNRDAGARTLQDIADLVDRLVAEKNKLEPAESAG